MAQGLGLASGFGAAGAAEGLREVLARQYAESLERSRQKRQAEQDAENTRRWNLDHERQLGIAKSLEDARAAQAARDRAAADKDAKRNEGLSQFITDPNAFQGMTPIQRLLALGQHGVANIGVHDVENPEEHRLHTTGDKEAAFADWKRRTDYTEQQLRTRPQRVSAANMRLIQDDPSLPRGVQSYLVQLRTKHPNFTAAAGELSRQMGNLQGAHPNLSPTKALDALRQAFTGAGGSSSDGGRYALLDATLATLDSGDTSAPMAAPNAGGGGRGGGPGAGGQIPPNSNGQSEAQLQQSAAAVLQQLGKDASPASVQKFLSNPQNRRRLLAGEQ